MNGDVLYEAEPNGEQRLDENLTAQVSDILQDVVQRGTGTAAAIGRPVAGKTGTTDDFRDAWFAGYIPQLSTVVWVGNLDHSPMPGVAGGGLPAQISAPYMAQAVADLEVESFPTPDWTGLTSISSAPEPDPTPTPTPDEDEDDDEDDNGPPETPGPPADEEEEEEEDEEEDTS